jgi:hypothetical protein
LTVVEKGGHGIGEIFDSESTLAIDKESASAAGEPAEERPVADFGFGDEEGGNASGEDDGIDIADVIGNNQTGSGHGALDIQVDSEKSAKPLAGRLNPSGTGL